MEALKGSEEAFWSRKEKGVGDSSILNKELAMGRWPTAVFGEGERGEKGMDG